MVSGLKLEDRLDGATNFRFCKTRILFILDENEIQNYVKENVSEPESVEKKARHKKNEAKAKRILIYSVKYHFILYIEESKISKGMFDSLVGLFESKNTSNKLALRNKLHCIMITKSDSISTYFMKVSQLRDQLKAIGDTIDDEKLVTMTLNELPSSWESFVQRICG